MLSCISYDKLLIHTSFCLSCAFVADNISYDILKIDVVTVSKVIILNLHLHRLYLKFKQSKMFTQDLFTACK